MPTSKSIIKTKAPQTFFIQTYGCAMNIADSERFRTILGALGYEEVEKRENADIIIFNSCSVRAKAEDRIYGLKKEIAELKTHNPQLITILTGCMARRRLSDDVKTKSKFQISKEDRAKEIRRHAPWLDIIIETTDFHRISDKLEAVSNKHTNVIQDDPVLTEVRNPESNDAKLDDIFKTKKNASSNVSEGNQDELERNVSSSEAENHVKQGEVENHVSSTMPTGRQGEVENFLDVTRTPTNNFTASITISHGCDHMCTFCIVPFARGREINRNFEPILKETKDAIKSGAKDIMLLGQTVNRWLNPNFESEYKNGNLMQTRINGINEKRLKEGKTPEDFLQLLEVLDSLDGDFWLSFMSSHPNYYTKELIDVIAESVQNRGHIRPYIHLALQSGNNDVLRRMRRNHTIEEFIEKVEYMKETIPEIAVTTDIIVGFPGESEKQFEDTAKVCKRLKFDQIYISEYSEREGTGSSFMMDDVSHEDKEKRKIIINDILRETALENNQKLIGTTQRVLVTKCEKGVILNSFQDPQKEGNERRSQKQIKYKYKARTRHNKLIQFRTNEPINPGQFVDLKVPSVTPWALEGELFKN